MEIDCNGKCTFIILDYAPVVLTSSDNAIYRTYPGHCTRVCTTTFYNSLSNNA
jgi:hypothetical protein